MSSLQSKCKPAILVTRHRLEHVVAEHHVPIIRALGHLTGSYLVFAASSKSNDEGEFR